MSSLDDDWQPNNIRQRSKGQASATSLLDRPGSSEYRGRFDVHVPVLKRRTREPLNESSFLCFLLLYIIVFSFVNYCDNLLPSPRLPGDRSTFSEGRARNFMNELSSLGGDNGRPTGSYANEVLAVDYLLKQLRLIQSAVGNTGVNKMNIDLQKAGGSFYIDFCDGLTSYYRNVKNIVAKIGPKTGRSLLVNCHFDSVPSSPGASDDAVSCAVMLEILWNIAWSKQPLKHSVVFLFNGAEENFLQASHGFITQHEWAKDIVAFINLEACGAGGREVLFQAGPGNEWLIDAYSKGAMYPFGSIMGQEIFQSGIIPSDTDFRIFRDYGKIPGLDFAFARNGYVYHTRFDNSHQIIPGTIQHEGENVLGTIYQILLHPKFEEEPQVGNTKVVYFDFLGLFLVSYTGRTGYILHGGAVILSLLSLVLKFRDVTMLHENVTSLIKAVVVVLGSFVASLVCVLSLASIISNLGCSMTWFYRPYWLVGLYICPSLAVMFFVHWRVAEGRRKGKPVKSDWEAEEMYYDAVRLFWVLLTSVMLFSNVYSAFLPTTWLLFPTLIRDLSGWMLKQKQNRSHLYYLLPHFAMQIVPLAFTAYCWLLVFSVFLPIMGRVGAHTNPDLIMAGLSVVVAFTSSSYVLPMVHITGSMKRTIGTMVGITIITITTVCLTPLGFPYSDDADGPAPQKFWIMHTSRAHHSMTGLMEWQDSGFWIIPLDYNGPDSLFPFVPDIRFASEVDCEEQFYCGMPYYFPVVTKLKKTYYLRSTQPKIYSIRKFQLLSQKMVQVNVKRLNFRIEGPDHMNLVFCPYPNVSLTSWSLGNGTAYTTHKWHDRPTYFVYYSHGEESGPWDVWIELELPTGLPSHQPVVDIAFHAHFMKGADPFSDDFKELLSKMPNWTHPVVWTSSYDSYVF